MEMAEYAWRAKNAIAKTRWSLQDAPHVGYLEGHGSD